MPFHDELVAARAHRHLRTHHLEHVVHDVQRIDGLGGQHARQGRRRLARQPLQADVIGRGLRLRARRVAQLQHQRVVALQVAAQLGELLALAEEALRQHLLAGQRSLTHAPREACS